MRTDSNIQASPAIGSDNLVYVNSFAGSMYAINISSGGVEWYGAFVFVNRTLCSRECFWDLRLLASILLLGVTLA